VTSRKKVLFRLPSQQCSQSPVLLEIAGTMLKQRRMMLVKQWQVASLLLAILHLNCSDAFTPFSNHASETSLGPSEEFKQTWSIASPTRLGSTMDEHESMEGERLHSQDEDFRTFLNQCCVQSFMFLLRTNRDPHTIRWLDNFTQPALKDYAWKPASPPKFEDESSYVNDYNMLDRKPASELLRYHGLDAMNTTLFSTWEDYFLELLRKSDETLVIETWDPRFPEFDIDVNPASLCSRLISVREQIAGEFVNDLGTISNMGQQIITQYWDEIEMTRERLRAEREAAEESSASGEPPSPPSSEVKDDSMKGFSFQWLGFLDWDPNYDDFVKPSPLRKGNFDLLMLLTTREATIRLLAEGVEDDTTSELETESKEFLRDFFRKRILTCFVGPQRYRRADEFIEDLMLSSPKIITKGSRTIIVDPLNIAEQLLIKRDELAAKWKQIAEVVPVEHSEIRRMQLNRLMGKSTMAEEENWQ